MTEDNREPGFGEVLLDRRSLLGMASLLALGGCAKCTLPAIRTIGRPVSDAHAHYFNASDLPVRGFLRHVIAPAWFPRLPGIALALGDLAGELAKRLSLTARREIRRLGPGELLGSDGPDAAEFGREAAAYQEQVINSRGFVLLADRKPETTLADSHFQLALILGVVRLRGEGPSERSYFSNGVDIDAATYAQIAGSETFPGDQSRGPGIPEPYRSWVSGDAAIDVKTIIRWVFLMCQPRCRHVLAYNAVITSKEAQVGDAANLLVDYDAWLGDGPLAGSDHAHQVAFWTRYADVTRPIAGATRLHSFAGFCPLKDTEERLDRLPSTLDRMKPWISAGRAGTGSHRIAGFKLYPPMGFRPDRNKGLVLPAGRAGDVVRARWEDRPWNLTEIGDRLDASLETFFQYCAAEDVPIIAHAAMSNGSMAGANEMAAPLHWLERAKMVAAYGTHPLRICLGHFDMYGFNNMVLAEALKMNRDPKLQTNIFFDVSYDNDILAENPGGLLDALARVCREAGDEGDYIMFGSDWIMLGQQRNAPQYLKTLYGAASTHRFWQDKVDKLFRSNFLRFLNVKS
jgi:hypothetical protein